MYQNMTREEMIQRLYDGNFTTGELERQLIAKLFEQCCGGGSGGDGGSSAGGGAFVVNVSASEYALTMDKTAKEIWEAAQSSTIIVRMPSNGEQEKVIVMCDVRKRVGASGYMFAADAYPFMADGDDVYPSYSVDSGDHN